VILNDKCFSLFWFKDAIKLGAMSYFEVSRVSYSTMGFKTMNELHFLRPYWLLLIIPLIWLVWRLWRQTDFNNAWYAVCDPHLLPHVMVNAAGKRQSWPLVLLAAAWLLATIALAGPSWLHLSQPVYRASLSKVIALDLSPAMYAQDISPDRLSRAKFKVQDILQGTQEGQVGMVVFSGEAYVVSPLTEDSATIAAMLPELNPDIMPVQGSSISAALIQAQALLQQAEATQGEIVLITASPVTQADLATAKQLHQQGIAISVLGIATEEGAPITTARGFVQDQQGNVILSKLDSRGLTELAAEGGGHYSPFSSNDSDLNTVLLNQAMDFDTGQTQEQTDLWQDQGRYFIFGLLPLALLAFRRGWFETINQ